MSEPPFVGVIGARSLVGRPLVPLLGRMAAGVLACSRAAAPATAPVHAGVQPHLTGAPLPTGSAAVTGWITLCPLWAVPDHLAWLERLGAAHVVAVSSMSGATKACSPDVAERTLAAKLTAAEAQLRAWAAARGIALTLLVPTMIYDGRTDGNVAAIAAWVRRFGWFPLCGPARGLRQPVHADDVAQACAAAVARRPPRDRYPLSGGEALPVCELVTRTCLAHGLTPRPVSLPPCVWRLAAGLARGLGIAAGLTPAMGRRMNEDLSCDHSAAAADLGFRPRPFAPRVDTLDSPEEQALTRPDGPRNDR